MTTTRKLVIALSGALGAVFFMALGLVMGGAPRDSAPPPPPAPLSSTDQMLLSTLLRVQYPRTLVSPLPYPLSPPVFELTARSALVVDAATGSIVYEQNPDEVMPPASLAKIAAMYVVLMEVAEGKYRLDDVVPLPAEAWAENAPSGSSLMGLSSGQVVTVGELLAGMAVASGNDAATALALFSAGTVDAFCNRVNAEMERLGLKKTRLVDASGYSEYNTTTAREFTMLARAYISRFPGALSEYHSAQVLIYPQPKNIARNREFFPVTLRNTNLGLSTILGCDGLKTGYIPEAGYNLALTVKRGPVRLIAVTLGGPGESTAIGNSYRFEDARMVTEWFFSNFYTRAAEETSPVSVRVRGGVQRSVRAVPAYSAPLTVPAIKSRELPEDAALRVSVTVEAPAELTAPVQAAEGVGVLRFSLGDVVLSEVPLVSDRAVAAKTPWFKKK